MLRRHNQIEKILFLIRNEEAFYVTVPAVVTKYKDGVITAVRDYWKNGEIYLDLDNGYGDIRLANVINFAYKCNFNFAFDELMKRNVIYIDGDRNNLDPKNLIWSNENASDDENGFRIIPGYSRYKINLKGMVINHVRGTEQQSYVDKYGYTFFGMTPDVGNRLPIGQHRLMAMSYLEIPPNFYEMDVNHIDGVKSNNSKDNLEWCTRKENCEHAYGTGLRSDNKHVLVRNVLTGDVIEHYSLAAAERKHGLGKNVASSRVISRGKKTFSDMTQFCLKDEFDEWGEVNLSKDLFISGIRQKVKVTNLETDKVTLYGSLTEAAEAVGVSCCTLSFRLRRNPPYWKDKKFSFEKIF